MDFKDILEGIMNEKGLKQTELGKLVGVKPSQVCEWLKGKSKAGYDSLRAICIALNISADEILGLDGDVIKEKKK